jgi:hypothetical protein
MAATMKREREWDAQAGGNKVLKEEPAPTFNPYTSLPYSQKFNDIYAKRKGAIFLLFSRRKSHLPLTARVGRASAVNSALSAIIGRETYSVTLICSLMRFLRK